MSSCIKKLSFVCDTMKDILTKLTTTELDEYREMFNLVDVEHRGYVTLSELRRLLDMLHLSLGDSEFRDLFCNDLDAERINPSGEDDADMRVVFEQFVRVMSRRVQDDYTPEQLRNAFRTFETDDIPEGHVYTHMLRYALANYGTEKMSDSEIERLIASIDPKETGVVNYITFVESLQKPVVH